jgi:hypothetical protein
MRLPDIPPHIPLHPLIERNRDIRQANYCWRAVARRRRLAARLLREQTKDLLKRSQMVIQSCQSVAQCLRREGERPP